MFFASDDSPFAPGAVNNLYVSERKNDKSAPWGPRINIDTIDCPRYFGAGCPPSAQAERNLAGWVNGETATATRTSIARSTGELKNR